MTFSKLIAGTIRNNGKYSTRLHPISGMIMHHAAGTNFDVVKNMMEAPYEKYQLSANYLIHNDGRIFGCVPEEYRAFTSADPDWDGRSITFECINETGAPKWTISKAAQEAIAQLLADVAERYDFTPTRPPASNRRKGNVFGHGELYKFFGASYATACPGGLPVTSITKRSLAIIKTHQEPPKPSNTSGSYAPKPGQLIKRFAREVAIRLSGTGRTSIAVGRTVTATATVTVSGRAGSKVRIGLRRDTYLGRVITGKKLVRKAEKTIPAAGVVTVAVSRRVELRANQRLRVNAKALGLNSVRIEKIVWKTAA